MSEKIDFRLKFIIERSKEIISTDNLSDESKLNGIKHLLKLIEDAIWRDL